MRKRHFLWPGVILLLSLSLARAQNSTKNDIPAGMEALPMGSGRMILMPRDTKSHKSSNVILLEGTNEYVTRKFIDLDKRISNIENFQNALLKRIEELTESLKKIETDIAKIKDFKENKENQEKVGGKDLKE